MGNDNDGKDSGGGDASKGGGGNGGGSGNGKGDKDSIHGSKGESKHDQNSAAIVGGILGSVIFLILVFFGVFFFRRRRRLARTSNAGQNRLPPMMYYVQSMPDEPLKGHGLYMVKPDSYIDFDSTLTFPTHKEVVDGSRHSRKPINISPSIPESAVVSDLPISDWSSYKGSSLIVQQSHAERSRFSSDTSAIFSPIAFRESTPTPAPRRTVKSPPQTDT